MNGIAFCRWLMEMVESGRAPSESECARRLGIAPKNLGRYKRDGGDTQLALACAALLRGLKPYV